jgi:hypothetical protein
MIDIAIASAALLLNLNTPSTPAHAASLPPTAIVVDDADPGFTRYGPASGWITATGTSFNYYGGSMTWTTNVVTEPINTATWALPVSATLPMTYEVFAFIPRYNSGTTNARYQIVHGGITDTRAISQNIYYAEWVSLGTYPFDAGGANLVQLTDSTGEPKDSRRIGFDALAFAPQVTTTITDVVTGSHRAYLPIVIGGRGGGGGSGGSAASTSRYISTMDPQRHTAMGCESGAAGEQGTIILAFGQAWMQDNMYGVIYYRSDFPFASTAAVAEATKGFLRGYWECAPGDAQLNLAVGTNNYKGATGYAHGQAWAQMVNQLHGWLQSNAPPGVKERIAVFGGNDIEMSWNTPALTRDWVNGYALATARPFVNFGSCDGCPTTGSPDRQPNNGWTVDDVWFVNREVVAIPFPEIYLRSGVNADQWYRMSLYAAQQKGSKLAFGGLLTQRQACQDVGGCAGTDNTPAQGWGQLQDAIDADARTAMTLPPPSDITWRNASVFTTEGTESTKANVSRVTAGDGFIVDGVQPPMSTMQFLASNAWVNDKVMIFAGLVRDPAGGGDDANSRGGLAIFAVNTDGEYGLREARVLAASVPVKALRIAGVEGNALSLTDVDGVVSLRYDLVSRVWLE